MPVIEPSTGRRVLVFAPSSTLPGVAIINSKKPFDGGVAYVHSDTMLNVSYSDHNGVAHAQTSVRLHDRAQDDTDCHGKQGESWYAVWMPYQFEQALRAQQPKVAPVGGDTQLKKLEDNGVPVGDTQPNAEQEQDMLERGPAAA